MWSRRQFPSIPLSLSPPQPPTKYDVSQDLLPPFVLGPQCLQTFLQDPPRRRSLAAASAAAVGISWRPHPPWRRKPCFPALPGYHHVNILEFHYAFGVADFLCLCYQCFLFLQEESESEKTVENQPPLLLHLRGPFLPKHQMNEGEKRGKVQMRFECTDFWLFNKLGK